MKRVALAVAANHGGPWVYDTFVRPKNQRIPAGFNKNSKTIMNEIITWNGGLLLNPSGIRKHLHVLTQGVGIRLDPVLSCMDPAGIEDTMPRS